MTCKHGVTLLLAHMFELICVEPVLYCLLGRANMLGGTDGADEHMLEDEHSYVHLVGKEKALLEAIPLVSRVRLFPEDGVPTTWNEMGVQLNLPAEFVPKVSRRRPIIHCSREKPTHLDVLRAMWSKLQHEYTEELSAAAKALKVRTAHPSSVAQKPCDAFNRLYIAGLAHQGLLKATKEAEALAVECLAAEQTATAARIEAERKAEEARTKLRAFEPKGVGQCRKRKTTATSKSDDESHEEQVVSNAPTQCQEDDARERPKYCAQWTKKQWRREETYIWRRRQVELSKLVPSRLPTNLPRGKKNGPLDHERRGLIGALQDWAEGSEQDAIRLLCALIKRLGLQVVCPQQCILHDSPH